MTTQKSSLERGFGIRRGGFGGLLAVKMSSHILRIRQWGQVLPLEHVQRHGGHSVSFQIFRRTFSQGGSQKSSTPGGAFGFTSCSAKISSAVIFSMGCPWSMGTALVLHWGHGAYFGIHDMEHKQTGQNRIGFTPCNKSDLTETGMPDFTGARLRDRGV